MACVNRELMACYLCKCMLPTSITHLQYLKHVQVSFPTLLLMEASPNQVKHNESPESDVRKAFLHLEQSKTLNPHLVQIHPSSPQAPVEGVLFLASLSGLILSLNNFNWFIVFILILCGT